MLTLNVYTCPVYVFFCCIHCKYCIGLSKLYSMNIYSLTYFFKLIIKRKKKRYVYTIYSKVCSSAVLYIDKLKIKENRAKSMKFHYYFFLCTNLFLDLLFTYKHHTFYYNHLLVPMSLIMYINLYLLFFFFSFHSIHIINEKIFNVKIV